MPSAMAEQRLATARRAAQGISEAGKGCARWLLRRRPSAVQGATSSVLVVTVMRFPPVCQAGAESCAKVVVFSQNIGSRAKQSISYF